MSRAAFLGFFLLAVVVSAVVATACAGGDSGSSEGDGDAAVSAGGAMGTGGAATGAGGAPVVAAAAPGQLGGPCLSGSIVGICNDGLACWAPSCRKLVPDCTAGRCGAEETCVSRLNGDRREYVCLPFKQAGAACHWPDEHCVDGYYCDQPSPGSTEEVCVPQAKPGESCRQSRFGACVPGYHCSSTCVADTPLGAPCQADVECGLGHFCPLDRRVCSPLRGEGEPCRRDFCTSDTCVGEQTSYCEQGLKCAPLPTATGCFSDVDCDTSRVCCANAAGAGECLPYQVCLEPLGVCAKPAGGASAGGATSSDASPRADAATGRDASRAPVPADLLDLDDWKLTLPVGSPGSPTEIKQPELRTFELAPYFVVDVARDGVVFQANAGGVTTSNSGYPRSELREMTNGGVDNASWSTSSGVHTMTITEAITHLPVVKPHAVAGQIHDASDDVVMVRLEGQNLFLEGGGTALGTLDPNYVLGARFTVRLEASGGHIRAYYGDLGTPKVDVSRNASGCYFKAGVYTQSNTSKGDAPDAYGEVIIYDLVVTHQ